jgi:hypothetical protein
MKYVIENNVSIPERAKWPFADMAVGQSVVVEGISCMPTQCRGYNAAQQTAKRLNMRFTGKSIGNGQVRIWRIQ